MNNNNPYENQELEHFEDNLDTGGHVSIHSDSLIVCPYTPSIISVLGCDGYETYIDNGQIFVRPKWTKCSDRLPPQDGTPFLGYDPDTDELGKIYVLIYVPEVKFPPGEFEKLSRQECYQESSGEGYFTWNPTHWMPLPEPPKD